MIKVKVEELVSNARIEVGWGKDEAKENRRGTSACNCAIYFPYTG
jgi:hypothetical protein